MDENDRLSWLSFSVFPGVGPVKFNSLLNYFGSAKNAWESSEKDLLSVLGPMLTKQLEAFRLRFDTKAYVQKLNKTNVSFVCLFEDIYPKLLKEIQKPPFVLYVKALRQAQGKEMFDFNHDLSVGVVGTRKITQYGKDVTEMITRDLVAQGSIIVSGLALGVDAVAHRTTIDNGGKTIAVLGCGVDCCTPGENQQLYDLIIASGGAIVSELPLGHGPTKGTFPSRNRIITGLSNAVVVTEGAEDSGALITADYAFKNNRKVFAVPGPITSHLSKGPYKLIEKGAKLVTKATDILVELRIKNHELRSQGDKGDKRAKGARGDTEEETLILELLQNEALHFDDIVKKTGLTSTQLGSVMSMMELKGLIKIGAGLYSI